MSADVTIQYTVPDDYRDGDYAMLFGNDGAGDIDYDAPLNNSQLQLLPNGSGIHGWYHTPWYHSDWYHGQSNRTPGWYHMPWYRFPWYYGATTIEVIYNVIDCGNYLFALKCFDLLGNANVGDPEEIDFPIHIAPEPPTKLKKNFYNKVTDVLVLDAA